VSAESDRFDAIDAAHHSRAVQHGVHPRHAAAATLALAHHVAAKGSALNRTAHDDPLVSAFYREHLKQHPEHRGPAPGPRSLKEEGFNL